METPEGMVAIVQGLQAAGLTITVTDARQLDYSTASAQRSRGVIKNSVNNSHNLNNNSHSLNNSHNLNNNMNNSHNLNNNMNNSHNRNNNMNNSHNRVRHNCCKSAGVQTYGLTRTQSSVQLCNAPRTSYQQPPHSSAGLLSQSQKLCRPRTNHYPNRGNDALNSRAATFGGPGYSHNHPTLMPVRDVQHPYRSALVWNDQPATSSRPSRATDAFVESLRKYPNTEMSTSADLIQRLISYTQTKNSSKTRSKSPRSSTRSASPEARDPSWVVQMSSKNVQTYTRVRQESPTRDVTSVYGKSERRRRVSPVRSEKGYSSATRQTTASYDYLKIGTQFSQRSTNVRYLNDVTKYVRDTLRQITQCDGQGQVCPHISSRYDYHRRSRHPAKSNTDPFEEQRQIASAKAVPAQTSSQPLATPSVKGSFKQNCDTECIRSRPIKIKDHVCGTCHRSVPCECSYFHRTPTPKQLRLSTFCKELMYKVCHGEESLDGCPCAVAVKNRIDAAVDDWLTEVPIYANFIPEECIQRDTLINNLKDNLKSAIGDNQKCGEEIMNCLAQLPMWVPPNTQDNKAFKEYLANRLMQKLKDNLKDTERINEIIRKWVRVLPLKPESGLDRNNISADLTAKLVGVLLRTSSEYQWEAIKQTTLEELIKMPIDCHPADKENLLIKLAEQLADSLLNDDFNLAVLQWLNNTVKLKPEPFVNKNKIAAEFSKELRDILDNTNISNRKQAIYEATLDELNKLPVDCESWQKGIIQHEYAEVLTENLFEVLDKEENSKKDDNFKNIVQKWMNSINFKPDPFVDRVQAAEELTSNLEAVANDPDKMKDIIITALKKLPIDCDPSQKPKILSELADNLVAELQECMAKDRNKSMIRAWVNDLNLLSDPPVDKSKFADELDDKLHDILANSNTEDVKDVLKAAIISEVKKLPLDYDPLDIDDIVSDLAENLAKNLASAAESDRIDKSVKKWMISAPLQLNSIDKKELTKSIASKLKDLVKSTDPQDKREAIKKFISSELSRLPLNCPPLNSDRVIQEQANKLADMIVQDKIGESVRNWIDGIPLKNYPPVDKEKISADLIKKIKAKMATTDGTKLKDSLNNIISQKLMELPLDCSPKDKTNLISELPKKLLDDVLRVKYRDNINDWLKNVPFHPDANVNPNKFADFLEDTLVKAAVKASSSKLPEILKNKIRNVLSTMPLACDPANKENLLADLTNNLAENLLKSQLKKSIDDWVNIVPFQSEDTEDKKQFATELTKEIKDIVFKKEPDEAITDFKDAALNKLQKYPVEGSFSKKEKLAIKLANKLGTLPKSNSFIDGLDESEKLAYELLQQRPEFENMSEEEIKEAIRELSATLKKIKTLGLTDEQIKMEMKSAVNKAILPNVLNLDKDGKQALEILKKRPEYTNMTEDEVKAALEELTAVVKEKRKAGLTSNQIANELNKQVDEIVLPHKLNMDENEKFVLEMLKHKPEFKNMTEDEIKHAVKELAAKIKEKREEGLTDDDIVEEMSKDVDKAVLQHKLGLDNDEKFALEMLKQCPEFADMTDDEIKKAVNELGREVKTRRKLGLSDDQIAKGLTKKLDNTILEAKLHLYDDDEKMALELLKQRPEFDKMTEKEIKDAVQELADEIKEKRKLSLSDGQITKAMAKIVDKVVFPKKYSLNEDQILALELLKQNPDFADMTENEIKNAIIKVAAEVKEKRNEGLTDDQIANALKDDADAVVLQYKLHLDNDDEKFAFKLLSQRPEFAKLTEQEIKDAVNELAAKIKETRKLGLNNDQIAKELEKIVDKTLFPKKYDLDEDQKLALELLKKNPDFANMTEDEVIKALQELSYKVKEQRKNGLTDKQIAKMLNEEAETIVLRNKLHLEDDDERFALELLKQRPEFSEMTENEKKEAIKEIADKINEKRKLGMKDDQIAKEMKKVLDVVVIPKKFYLDEDQKTAFELLKKNPDFANMTEDEIKKAVNELAAKVKEKRRAGLGGSQIVKALKEDANNIVLQNKLHLTSDDEKLALDLLKQRPEFAKITDKEKKEAIKKLAAIVKQNRQKGLNDNQIAKEMQDDVARCIIENQYGLDENQKLALKLLKERPEFHLMSENEIEKAINDLAGKIQEKRALGLSNSAIENQIKNEVDSIMKVLQDKYPKKYSVSVSDWLKDVKSSISKEATEKLFREVLLHMKKLRAQGIEEDSIRENIRKEIDNHLSEIGKDGNDTPLDSKTRKRLGINFFNKIMEDNKPKHHASPEVEKAVKIEITDWAEHLPNLKAKGEIRIIESLTDTVLQDDHIDEHIDDKNVKIRIKEEIKHNLAKAYGRGGETLDPKRKNELADNLLNKLTHTLHKLETSKSKVDNKASVHYAETYVQTSFHYPWYEADKIASDTKYNCHFDERKRTTPTTKHELTDQLSSSLTISDEHELQKRQCFDQFDNKASLKVKNEVIEWIEGIPEFSSFVPTKKEKKILTHAIISTFNKLRTLHVDEGEKHEEIEKEIIQHLDNLETKGQHLEVVEKNKFANILIDKIDKMLREPTNASFFDKNEVKLQLSELFQEDVKEWIKNIPQLKAKNFTEKKNNNKFVKTLAKGLNILQIRNQNKKKLRNKMSREIKDKLDRTLRQKRQSIDIETENTLTDKLLDKLISSLGYVQSFSPKKQISTEYLFTSQSSSTEVVVKPVNETIKKFERTISEWIENIPKLTSSTSYERKENRRLSHKLAQKFANVEVKAANYSAVEEQMKSEIRRELNAALRSRGEDIDLKSKNLLTQTLVDNLIDATNKFKIEKHFYMSDDDDTSSTSSENKISKTEIQYLENCIIDWVENIPELASSNLNQKKYNKRMCHKLAQVITNFGLRSVTDSEVKEKILVEIKSELSAALKTRGEYIGLRTRNQLVKNLLSNVENIAYESEIFNNLLAPYSIESLEEISGTANTSHYQQNYLSKSPKDLKHTYLEPATKYEIAESLLTKKVDNIKETELFDAKKEPVAKKLFAPLLVNLADIAYDYEILKSLLEEDIKAFFSDILNLKKSNSYLLKSVNKSAKDLTQYFSKITADELRKSDTRNRALYEIEKHLEDIFEKTQKHVDYRTEHNLAEKLLYKIASDVIKTEYPAYTPKEPESTIVNESVYTEQERKITEGLLEIEILGYLMQIPKLANLNQAQQRFVNKAAKDLAHHFSKLTTDELRKTDTKKEALNKIKKYLEYIIDNTLSENLSDTVATDVYKIEALENMLKEDIKAFLSGIPELANLDSRIQNFINKVAKELALFLSEMSSDDLRKVEIKKRAFNEIKKYLERIFKKKHKHVDKMIEHDLVEKLLDKVATDVKNDATVKYIPFDIWCAPNKSFSAGVLSVPSEITLKSMENIVKDWMEHIPDLNSSSRNKKDQIKQSSNIEGMSPINCKVKKQNLDASKVELNRDLKARKEYIDRETRDQLTKQLCDSVVGIANKGKIKNIPKVASLKLATDKIVDDKKSYRTVNHVEREVKNWIAETSGLLIENYFDQKNLEKVTKYILERVKELQSRGMKDRIESMHVMKHELDTFFKRLDPRTKTQAVEFLLCKVAMFVNIPVTVHISKGIQENISQWLDEIPEMAASSSSERRAVEHFSDALTNKFINAQSRGVGNSDVQQEMLQEIKKQLEIALETKGEFIPPRVKNELTKKLLQDVTSTLALENRLEKNDSQIKILRQWFNDIPSLRGGEQDDNLKLLNKLNQKLNAIQTKAKHAKARQKEVEKEINKWLKETSRRKDTRFDDKTRNKLASKLATTINCGSRFSFDRGSKSTSSKSYKSSFESYSETKQNKSGSFRNRPSVERRKSSPSFTDKEPEVYYVENAKPSEHDKPHGSFHEISKEIDPEVQNKVRELIAQNIHVINSPEGADIQDKILEIMLNDAGLPSDEAELITDKIMAQAHARALQIGEEEMEILRYIQEEIKALTSEYNIRQEKQADFENYLSDLMTGQILESELEPETRAILIQNIMGKGGVTGDEAEQILDRIQNRVGTLSASGLELVSQIKSAIRCNDLGTGDEDVVAKAKKVVTDFINENVNDPTPTQLSKISDVADTIVNKVGEILADNELTPVDRREFMQNLIAKQLRRMSFMNPDSSITNLAENLVDRLEGMNLITSTPKQGANINESSKKSSDISDRRNSANEEKYAKKIKGVIRNWLENLPIDPRVTEDKEFITTIVKDLAGDIIDRQKYLQLNPDVRTTDAEELDNLKYQCYRWMKKFLADDDLNVAVGRADELLEAITGVKVPNLNKDHRKRSSSATALTAVVNDWLKQLPLYQTATLQDKKDMDAAAAQMAKNLKRFIDSGSIPPDDFDDIIRDEILNNLANIVNDPELVNDSDFMKSTAEGLLNHLKGQRAFQEISGLSEVPSIDCLAVAVDEWVNGLSFNANTPVERKRLKDAKKALCGKLKMLRQKYHPTSPQYEKALKDEIKNFLMNNVTDPTLKNDESYLEEQANAIVKNLHGIPIQKSKDAIDKPAKNAADTLYEYISNWCEELPVKDPSIKKNLTSKLMNKVNELNMNPDILNDDVLYEDFLRDEIDKLLDEVPKNPELDKYLPLLKKDLISKVMDCRQMLLNELAGRAYKQQLKDTISTSLSAPDNLTPDEIASLEILKDRLADAFIDLQYSPNCGDARLKYKNKVSQAVNKFCTDILQRYPCLPMDSNKIKRDMHQALLKVPHPKDETMKSEIEQVRIRDIIDEWMKEIPLRHETAKEKLHRHKLAAVLTKRLHDLEVEKDFNPDAGPKMSDEITTFLKKMPLVRNSELLIPELVEKLIYWLNNSVESRKFESSFSSCMSLQPVCSTRYPCTLSSSDKSHLMRINQRSKKRPCYADLASLMDSCSQTDNRDICRVPQTEGICPDKIVSSSRKCQTSPLKSDASSMTTTHIPCEMTPHVIVKEYIWGSLDATNLDYPVLPPRSSMERDLARISQGVQSTTEPRNAQRQSVGNATTSVPRASQSQTASANLPPKQSLYESPCTCPSQEKEIPCTSRPYIESKSPAVSSREDINCDPRSSFRRQPCSSSMNNRPRSRSRTCGDFESDWSAGIPLFHDDFEHTCWRHSGRAESPCYKKERTKEKLKCKCRERVMVSCASRNNRYSYRDMCQKCGSTCPHPSSLYFRR